MVDDIEDQTALLGEYVSVLQTESSTLQDTVADLQNMDVEFDKRISNLESSTDGNITGTNFILQLVKYFVSFSYFYKTGPLSDVILL